MLWRGRVLLLLCRVADLPKILQKCALLAAARIQQHGHMAAGCLEKPSSLHPSHIIRSVQTMLTTPVQVCRQPACKSVSGMDLDSLLRLAAAFPA